MVLVDNDMLVLDPMGCTPHKRIHPQATPPARPSIVDRREEPSIGQRLADKP